MKPSTRIATLVATALTAALVSTPAAAATPVKIYNAGLASVIGACTSVPAYDSTPSTSDCASGYSTLAAGSTTSAANTNAVWVGAGWRLRLQRTSDGGFYSWRNGPQWVNVGQTVATTYRAHSEQLPTGAAAQLGLTTRAFTDDFSGTALDESRWEPMVTSMNEVQTDPANISVSGGQLALKLSDSSTGAEIDSAPYDGAGANGYLFEVGHYVEARVYFPGDDAVGAYNWPAWWTSGPDWPTSGEFDIAENLGGQITTNYHYGTEAAPRNIAGGPIPGARHNAWNTYGAHRKATSTDIYFNGTKVKTFPTSDSGRGHALLLNIGKGQGSTTKVGAAYAFKADYVRAWR